MQVTNTSASQNIHSARPQNKNQAEPSINFLSQLPQDVQDAFNEASVGLDEETKKKRAMTFSLNMMNPIFLTFKDGNYPDKMPSSVKSALQTQNREYASLSSEKEQNTYKIKWMIEHIVYKQSSDPAGEAFVKEVYKNYTGVRYDQGNSRDAINDGDGALQQFKKDLTTKGATRFLNDFNQEKIDELVDKFKDTLLKELEVNPDADIDIEKLVSDYRKELLLRLQELEKEGKKSPVNIQKIQFDLLDKLSVKLEDALAI